MTTTCTMILGDCLEVMPTLPSNTVQMCFADFPYICTQSKWEKEVSLSHFWQAFVPICLPRWTLAATATFRFAVRLFDSAQGLFKYDLVFNKLLCSGFLRAKTAPMRYHENLLIFGDTIGIYNPQRQPRDIGKRGTNWQRGGNHESWGFSSKARRYEFTDTILPRSVLPVMGEAKRQLVHSAQKPVALLEWLIRTYSNGGDMVLDPTSGSGTTAVSACQNGRSVTCIEKDEGYFETSVDRVRKHIRDNLLDVKLEVRK